jgi:hypothetical protein
MGFTAVNPFTGTVTPTEERNIRSNINGKHLETPHVRKCTARKHGQRPPVGLAQEREDGIKIDV